MPQNSIDLPFTNGMDFGIGIDLLDGSIDGKAVTAGAPVPPDHIAGQTVRYTLTIINSFEELYSSLGISVDASGHYGLFSASAKFNFAKESKFNSQSTFLIARCVVENAFIQVLDGKIVEGSDGWNLLKAGRRDDFKARYGDAYVRGMQTGGEFFAVISITSSTREEQQSIAASLAAKYGGLFASVSVDVKVDDQTKSKLSRSEIQINTFQRGGSGDEAAITADIAAVMARLKDFPAQVLRNPVPYSAQVARYVTLALPDGPSPLDIEFQEEALQRYESARLKVDTMLNDIAFMQAHPDLFVNPPDAATLNGWQDILSDEYNALTHQASLCYRNANSCPVLPFTVPPGYTTVQRKVTNAIDAFAAADSFPTSVFKRTIDAPADFQVTARLVTSFKDQNLPGAYYGVGFVLFSDALNRGIWFLKGVGETGPTISCFAFNQEWSVSQPIGSKDAAYPDDEIYLRLIRKGPQLLDASFSQDANVWKPIARQVNLADCGLPDGTPLRLVLGAYSTTDKSVAGTFYDVNVVPV